MKNEACKKFCKVISLTEASRSPKIKVSHKPPDRTQVGNSFLLWHIPSAQIHHLMEVPTLLSKVLNISTPSLAAYSLRHPFAFSGLLRTKLPNSNAYKKWGFVLFSLISIDGIRLYFPSEQVCVQVHWNSSLPFIQPGVKDLAQGCKSWLQSRGFVPVTFQSKTRRPNIRGRF